MEEYTRQPGDELKRLDLLLSAAPPRLLIRSPRPSRFAGEDIIPSNRIIGDGTPPLCIEYHSITAAEVPEFLARAHRPKTQPPLSRKSTLVHNLQIGVFYEAKSARDPGFINSVLCQYFVYDFHPEIQFVAEKDPTFKEKLFKKTLSLLNALPEPYLNNGEPADLNCKIFDDNTIILAAQTALLELTNSVPPVSFLENMKSYVTIFGEALSHCTSDLIEFQPFLKVAWQRFNNLLFYAIARRLCQNTWTKDILAITGVYSQIPPFQEDLLGMINYPIHEKICPRAMAVLVDSPAGRYLDYRVYRDLLRGHLEGLSTDIRDSLLGHSLCTTKVCDHHRRQAMAQSATNPDRQRNKEESERLYNQSQHDLLQRSEIIGRCKGRQLVIDISSFSRIRKAMDPGDKSIGRVVDVHATDSNIAQANMKLLYSRFPTSGGTVAITHVWSHGQGGSPEDGFNICLHERYSLLTRTLGCDSYWIDSACIPRDERFRVEAIKTLNQIFMESKIVLIVDRVIQTIEHTNNELLLAAVAMSDWNTRSWTFFEGIMGSGRLYLLCKNNKIVSLAETCTEILNQRTEAAFAIGMIALQHIFTSAKLDYVGDWLDPRNSRDHVWERTGNSLALRRASRDGDDRKIWSLLLYGSEYSTTLSIDPQLLGASVYSGFILSAMPRLCWKSSEGNSISWLPLQPGGEWTSGDGAGSYTGNILQDGSFLCRWFIKELTPLHLENYKDWARRRDRENKVIKLDYSGNLVLIRPKNQRNNQMFSNAAMICKRVPFKHQNTVAIANESAADWSYDTYEICSILRYGDYDSLNEYTDTLMRLL